MKQDIFVHFLNRELYRSLKIKQFPNVSLALKVMMLACGEAIHVPLSSLWESYNNHIVDYDFIKLLYDSGRLEVISDCVTIEEFLERNLQMYSFDKSRYRNIYFRPIKRINWLQPTEFKRIGATKAISDTISMWAEDSDTKLLLPESEISVLNANKSRIIETNLQRENRALTVSLFSDHLLRKNDQLSVARFLSAYYILDYCRWLDADIITGLSGNLTFYDYLAQEYPYHDFRILSEVLSLAGATPIIVNQIKYSLWETLLNDGISRRVLSLVPQIIQHAINNSMLLSHKKTVSPKDVKQYLIRTIDMSRLKRIGKFKSWRDLEALNENLSNIVSQIQRSSNYDTFFPINVQNIITEKKGPISMEHTKRKLFISHSTKDQEYVKLLVELIESIGLTEIVCSSVPGYGVPLNQDIYDYLRSEFQQNELYVLFVLSDNYYESAASLNEMGAAWVLQKDYLCILLPGFEFKEIEGAVNPRKISIKLDAEQLTVCEYLNQWKAQLETNFHLTPIQQARWERIRTDFLEKTRKLSSSSTAV